MEELVEEVAGRTMVQLYQQVSGRIGLDTAVPSGSEKLKKTAESRWGGAGVARKNSREPGGPK